jgi:hypothetical protein
MNRHHLLALTFPLLALLSACSKSDSTNPPPISPAPAAGSPKYVLATDPGKAATIVDGRKAAAGERVTVEGRIQKVVKGVAAFTLMGKDLPYCGEKGAEDCKTPWDYCCEPKDTRLANSLSVEIRGTDGKPIAGPLADLRLLDLVKVTGQLNKDEHGNQVLLADGVFRVQRPQLPDGLHWPQ